MANEKKLREALELAKREINRQQAALALSYLRPVQYDADELEGTALGADHQLTFAEGLAALNDLAAKTEFEDALDRLSRLRDREPTMELRAHEHFGSYLARRCRRSLARQHYEAAKKAAVELRRVEDSDRIQLLIVAVDLESDDDPRIESLRNLKNAAKDRDYTAQEQYAAWVHYVSRSSPEQQPGFLAARLGSVAPVEYFRSLLKSIREAPQNEASA